ncbi:MAG: hypothetical protein HYS12_29215 [Planctomycetes bacterium]|nr:hypothetical protein [Planctomycetota bacterium]
MQNTCPNPTCGAMYNLTPQHVGRSFACKKCGSTLVVSAAGLELAGVVPAGTEPLVQPVDEDPAPMRRPSSFGVGAGAAFSRFWERIKADTPTWLLGVGIFFVVTCLFLPLLDLSKVDRRRGKIEAGESKLARQEDETRRKIAAEKDPDKQKKYQEAQEDARKKWAETEKPKLQEDLDDMRESARSWRYWYDWGMMWGFLFLGYAALAYLTPQQSTIRRIVGSIVLCTMLVFIFVRFIFVEDSARRVEAATREIRGR